jgi:hypothetical protein
MLGILSRDNTRSTDTRKQLETERIMQERKKYQRKWNNHVERMPPERLQWEAYFYCPIGRRDIGHQRRRRSQQFL